MARIDRLKELVESVVIEGDVEELWVLKNLRGKDYYQVMIPNVPQSRGGHVNIGGQIMKDKLSKKKAVELADKLAKKWNSKVVMM